MEISILKHEPLFWAVWGLNSENFVCFARFDRKPLFWPGFLKIWFCLCVLTASALFCTQNLKNVFFWCVLIFSKQDF